MKQGRTVLQAKRYGVYLCQAKTTLLDAAQRMMREDVSSLAVVDDDGYLVGIITRVDLLRAYLKGDYWSQLKVEEFMVREVVTVTPYDKLLDVANLLVEKQIHRVIVIQPEEDGRRKPVAVVSAADLVYHMVKWAGTEVGVVSDEETED